LSAAIGTFSSQFPRDLMNSRDIYFVPQRLEQLGNALRTSTTPSRSPPPASRCTRQETRRTGISRSARQRGGPTPAGLRRNQQKRRHKDNTKPIKADDHSGRPLPFYAVRDCPAARPFYLTNASARPRHTTSARWFHA
jgi:hypothetical protein